jgi:hypothetical protein
MVWGGHVEAHFRVVHCGLRLAFPGLSLAFPFGFLIFATLIPRLEGKWTPLQAIR